MRRNRTRKPRTITVLQKLYESGLAFSMTDLKWINGGSYYLDWAKEYPNTELPEKEVLFDGKLVKLFEFPSFFEKKVESKIFFHFQRKADNLRNHAPRGKVAEPDEDELPVQSHYN